jgi:hypothetical protein
VQFARHGDAFARDRGLHHGIPLAFDGEQLGRTRLASVAPGGGDRIQATMVFEKLV